MMKNIAPAEAGMPEEAINRFLSQLARAEINMHSLLLCRGDGIFFERYWAPFGPDTVHRMYSVTKSFVAIAIGCLVEEGKLSLSDPIVKFFPDKLPEPVPELLARQTVEDMLTMRTCFVGGQDGYWFQPGLTDRTAYYFDRRPMKPAGTLFDYDSTGSYILGVLVERLSGIPLLDYLKQKVLSRIGGFDQAEILRTPDGTSWGDSALLCTPRALMNFARFVMNRGVWEGERLMDAGYLSAATACQTDNNLDGGMSYDRHGYGYQFWRSEQGSFMMNGMGGQFALCVPEKDFILVCTGDNQLTGDLTAPAMFRAAFDCLVDALPPGPAPAPVCDGPAALPVAHGAANSPFTERINGRWFACEDNPMGIRRFRFTFTGDEGVFEYENAQGEKRLPFGMKRNLFGKFPQRGYSDGYGNVHDEQSDFLYGCAASGGWLEPRKLQLKVQILDRYFGLLTATFGFTEDLLCGARMVKAAEDFLSEYNGWMIARPAED